jgi:hypothetical protein
MTVWMAGLAISVGAYTRGATTSVNQRGPRSPTEFPKKMVEAPGIETTVTKSDNLPTGHAFRQKVTAAHRVADRPHGDARPRE